MFKKIIILLLVGSVHVKNTRAMTSSQEQSRPRTTCWVHLVRHSLNLTADTNGNLLLRVPTYNGEGKQVGVEPKFFCQIPLTKTSNEMINKISPSPNGQFLVVSTTCQQAYLLDTDLIENKDGQCFQFSPSKILHKITWSPDSTFFCFVFADGTSYFYPVTEDNSLTFPPHKFIRLLNETTVSYHATVDDIIDYSVHLMPIKLKLRGKRSKQILYLQPVTDLEDDKNKSPIFCVKLPLMQNQSSAILNEAKRYNYKGRDGREKQALIFFYQCPLNLEVTDAVKLDSLIVLTLSNGEKICNF